MGRIPENVKDEETGGDSANEKNIFELADDTPVETVRKVPKSLTKISNMKPKTHIGTSGMH